MVERRWQDELPEVVVHTAYYAMYHAAIAVFAKRGLAKPKTHSGLAGATKSGAWAMLWSVV
jgi:uncharacterized protein (UPF0332 family)